MTYIFLILFVAYLRMKDNLAVNAVELVSLHHHPFPQYFQVFLFGIVLSQQIVQEILVLLLKLLQSLYLVGVLLLLLYFGLSGLYSSML